MRSLCLCVPVAPFTVTPGGAAAAVERRRRHRGTEAQRTTEGASAGSLPLCLCVSVAPFPVTPGGGAGCYFSQRASQPWTSAYQWREFWGFRIQWFSSG